MAAKTTKWSYDRPNGHTMYKHLPLQDLTKFTQIGIFGLKIYHLATLASTIRSFQGAKKSSFTKTANFRILNLASSEILDLIFVEVYKKVNTELPNTK
jgi:hypothetical protein